MNLAKNIARTASYFIIMCFIGIYCSLNVIYQLTMKVSKMKEHPSFNCYDFDAL